MNGIRYIIANEYCFHELSTVYGGWTKLRDAVNIASHFPRSDTYFAHDGSTVWRKISKEALRKTGYLK